MANILIAYGSTTGSTETLAEEISDKLEAASHEVNLTNVTDIEADELNDDYDIYLLGSSTWGDAEIEFQEDMEEFYDDMDGMDLSGKKFAVFGCGDTSFPHFCGAVDVLEEKIKELGGVLLNNGLKVEGDVDEDVLTNWLSKIL